MFIKRGWRRHAVAWALVLPTLAGGCGEDEAPDDAREPAASSQSSPTSSAAEPSASVPSDAPDCEKVWKDGAKLPRGYPGCVDGQEFVKRDAVSCSSGQRMIRYADHFYGVLGGTVHETAGALASDRDYRAAIRSCTA